MATYSFERVVEANHKVHALLDRLLDKRDAFKACGLHMHANRINNLAAHILFQSKGVCSLLRNYPI